MSSALAGAAARLETLDVRGVALPRVTLEHGDARVVLLGVGAAVQSLGWPDREGQRANVVLGFRDPARYLLPHPYFGVTVGRFANRIADSAFELDGVRWALPANDGPHCLHGGARGFHSRIFEVEPFEERGAPGARFRRTSPHGEEGFPGTLELEIRALLRDDGALVLDYLAATDRPTVVSLSHHGYWNLSGGARDIREHRLTVHADQHVPLGVDGIPVGGPRSVAGGPLDFRTATRLGDRLDHPDLASRGGLDHPFVVRGAPGALVPVAALEDPVSGRGLRVSTDAPAIHVYSGQNSPGADLPGPALPTRHAALCLETGAVADAPNQPHLGRPRLDPGERYAHRVVYAPEVRTAGAL
ncbi:MAG: galactose mutarotase [Deltaproteobacteria bacterium]|nr:galactose mutarotase [Deltaproteobacteria bacterium]